MCNQTNVENLLLGCGYPVKKVRKEVWAAAFGDGVTSLILEFSSEEDLFWVQTNGYLRIPVMKRYDPFFMARILRAKTGLAQIGYSPKNARSNQYLEIKACIPKQELTTSLVSTMTTAVLDTAIGWLPRLQAITHGLPLPPAWPKEEDPALGILWAGVQAPKD